MMIFIRESLDILRTDWQKITVFEGKIKFGYRNDTIFLNYSCVTLFCFKILNYLLFCELYNHKGTRKRITQSGVEVIGKAFV
jgi:hypothetical protein